MNRSKLSPDEIRLALNGPIPSIRIPFKRDGAIDYKALRGLLDFCIDAGSKALMLTYGDSLYSTLTDDEVADVTKATVQHVRGRAVVIAADRVWWTGKAAEFAKFCKQVGADILMTLPPDWAASSTAETLTAHYAAVGKHMPVMMVTGLFIGRGQAFGLKTVEMVRDKVPAVIAVKDDFCGDFARRMSLLVHGKWAVISGGLKSNHLNNHPYGCDGYLSTFISWKPAVAWNYWRAVQANDTAAIREAVRRDNAFFDFIMAFPGGFDAAMHGVGQLAGRGGRWRRTPYFSLSDAEMEKLKDFMVKNDYL